MIFDNNGIFSGAISAAGVVTGQTIATTGTTTSTNVYDLGIARDLGKGETVNCIVEVLTAPVGATSITVQVVEADDAAISVNVTPISVSAPMSMATLVAGAQIPMYVDRVTPDPARRYLAVQYVVAGALTTAPSIFAALAKNVSDPGTYYSSGFSVL